MVKTFYIFAGVNGSGKSTLYNSIIDDLEIKESIRINTDEIVRRLGNWDDEALQIKAAKIAINLRNKCINEGKSFNEETTLTGKTILKIIDKAIEKGYKIHLYYVGVDNFDIAVERVKNRVSRGGHNIPKNIIMKRYYESLENFKKIILKCNVIEIFDNTKRYERLFYYIDGKTIDKAKKIPEWAKVGIKNIINKNG